MFERYTEKARRAIFFARYEASQFGLQFIDANCLLIGLVRENGQIATRWLGLDATELHRIVESQTMRSNPISTSVDLPLTNEVKRVLAYAAEEADNLAHRHIGTEHLFLGLLHESGTLAAERIKERGMTIKEIRKAISQEAPSTETAPRPVSSRHLQVRLVNEANEQIAIYLWISRPPAIVEAIMIKFSEESEARYRILDLVWSVRAGEDEIHPREIVLKVRIEQP